jgi:Skp family chaperone for outer membrane proteins
MKRLLRTLIPAVLLAALLTSTGWAETRIATVDLRKLFDGYWKTKQADAALKDRAADMEKEHKNMIDDWKKAKEDYSTLLNEASSQTISAEEREKRKTAAEAKLKYLKDTEETIGQYERQARATLDEQKRRMRDNILNEIRTIVNGKAKSGSFNFVIDSAAETINNTPVVLFNDGANDLTDEVLKELNLNAPAIGAKPAAAADTNELALPPIKTKK